VSFRKLKIVQPGWETYTGFYGSVEFVDGLSTEAVPEVFADRVSADIIVVDAETGDPVGVAERMVTAGLIRLKPEAPLERAPEVSEEKQKKSEEKIETPAVEPDRVYTEAELEAIASAKGMRGLREIGNKLAVRGRAIPELIGDILAAQSKLIAERDNRLQRGDEAIVQQDQVETQINPAEETQTDSPAEIETTEGAENSEQTDQLTLNLTLNPIVETSEADPEVRTSEEPASIEE
jgi:hypothetical protein